MGKTLKHHLLKQQKNIDEEIFHHLSRIKVLNDTPKEILQLSPAEIFAKTQLYKIGIAKLVLKKEKVEFTIDLLNKSNAKIYKASVLHEYPVFVTKIIHYN